jgi:hypothetical protein
MGQRVWKRHAAGAGRHPDIVESLVTQWREWASRVGVIDWDGMLARCDAVGAPRFTAEE